MSFEDLIDDKSREKLNGIIEARKQAEHEEWLNRLIKSDIMSHVS